MQDDEEVAATYATTCDTPDRKAPWVDVPEAQPRCRFRSRDVTKSVTAYVTTDGVLHYDPKTTEYDDYSAHSAMREEAAGWTYPGDGTVQR